MRTDDDSPRFDITCPNCQCVNGPRAVLCRQCMSPLSNQASSDPFQSISARGDAFTRASRQPTNLVTVIGIWLIFGNIGTVASLAVVFALHGMIFDRSAPFLPLLLAFLIFGALLGVSAKLIQRTTKNYMRYRREPDEEDDDEVHDQERSRE